MCCSLLYLRRSRPHLQLSLTVLYNLGWAPSILLSIFYGPFAFFALIGYLAAMKRIVMPHMAGEYPIFRSVKCAKWQMLALNAHIYQDFNAAKGSLVRDRAQPWCVIGRTAVGQFSCAVLHCITCTHPLNAHIYQNFNAAKGSLVRDRAAGPLARWQLAVCSCSAALLHSAFSL